MIQPFYESENAALVAMLNDVAVFMTDKEAHEMIPAFLPQIEAVKVRHFGSDHERNYIFYVDPLKHREGVTNILKERARKE